MIYPLVDLLVGVLSGPLRSLGSQLHLPDFPRGGPTRLETLQAVAGHPKSSPLCSLSLRDHGLGCLDVHCFVSYCFIYLVYFWDVSGGGVKCSLGYFISAGSSY